MTAINAELPTNHDTTLADTPCFIETQFPVAKISMESYKERKAGKSQTITGLGKWWGRKPLILVRATILGLLLPITENPEKDREIFLKLLTMDREGLHLRKSKSIPEKRLVEEHVKLPPSIQQCFFDVNSHTGKIILGKIDKERKAELQFLVFDRMPYGEKLEYCDRPEQIDGPSANSWKEINSHLGTKSNSVNELVIELGKRRFGHHPWVGDSFCGGGSIPFEAARLGLNSYGSDLNPVAALLSWASLNLIGKGEGKVRQLRKAQEKVFRIVDRQITDWGIEHNSAGWRADAFLYCVEVIDPQSGWKIPLAPSWVISQKYKVIAKLIPDEKNKILKIEVEEGVTEEDIKKAKENGTIKDSRVINPLGQASIPIDVIRKDMRMWGKNDFQPSPLDTFQERLYCIRWIETIIDDHGKAQEVHHFRAPSDSDLKRESLVSNLLGERLNDWQEKGYIPSRKIEPGYNTTQPIRERGWTYWHHLSTPRQLLIHGLFSETAFRLFRAERDSLVISLLGVGSCSNWNSKLCIWNSDASKGPGNTEQTFANQALNTQFNFGCRGFLGLFNPFFRDIPNLIFDCETNIKPIDAREINNVCDIWITDPPYADAVNYEEISEFFLAWYESGIKQCFPSWPTDTRRALAIKGNASSFSQTLAQSYRSLVINMPDDGIQVVMFTHQDAGVWADLTMILWAAGLRVTAAWTIGTETSSGLKAGNYVQGTVLLVLRKRTISEPVFLDEISHKVEDEVRRQLDEMTRMEDDSDPNFGDADYQLAAYAAALRVLTGQPIEEIDPEKEILRERKPGEVGPVEALIRRAVKIACDHLIPKGLDADLWKTLGPMERFYIKGLEVESHGEYRSGVYQELARGFGATAYTDLLESTKANETRLKSASEFGKKMLGTFGLTGESFTDSLVRQCLFAVWLTVKNEATREGLDYLHTELREAYWSNREKITDVLEYLAALRHSETMDHWQKDSQGAALLAGAVRNDHV